MQESKKKIERDSHKKFMRNDNHDKMKMSKLRLRKQYRGLLNTP